MQNKPRFEPVMSLPKLHTTPLADVHVEGSGRPRVVVELDDVNEKRFRLVFGTYQAVRVTTDDCFSPVAPITSRAVVEVINSPWIAELTAVLKRKDDAATFMQKAKHFLIPNQDNFIEIVAWNIKHESM